MSELDYRKLKIEEERRLLRDFGSWDLVAFGAAFLVEPALSPKSPEVIDRQLELWRPIADWPIEGAGVASVSSGGPGEGDTP